jgi:hypothetical protein
LRPPEIVIVPSSDPLTPGAALGRPFVVYGGHDAAQPPIRRHVSVLRRSWVKRKSVKPLFVARTLP